MSYYTLAISNWFGVRDVEAFTKALDHHANPGLPETRIETRASAPTVRVAFHSQWQTYDASDDWDYYQVLEVTRQHIAPGCAAIFMYVDASSPWHLVDASRWHLVTSTQRDCGDLHRLHSDHVGRATPGITALGF